MKFSSWAKATAFSLTALTMSEVTTAQYFGINGKRTFEDKATEYDGVEITNRLKQQKIDTAFDLRLMGQMNVHANLLFECGPKIAVKVDGLQSADGHELVKKKADTFVVWQVDKQRFETWENIYNTIDPATKTQVCATYNPEHKDFVMHLGGTDFSNVKDMTMAVTAILGHVTPRVAAGATCTETAVEKLLEKHPDLDPADVHVGIVAHSRGGEATPMSKVAFIENGFSVNKTVILDPFGTATAYEAVEKELGIPAEILRDNTVSIKPHKKGPLDKFSHAARSVGEKEMCHAAGHLGKNFIMAFDQQRVAQHQKTLKN